MCYECTLYRSKEHAAPAHSPPGPLAAQIWAISLQSGFGSEPKHRLFDINLESAQEMPKDG